MKITRTVKNAKSTKVSLTCKYCSSVENEGLWYTTHVIKHERLRVPKSAY